MTFPVSARLWRFGFWVRLFGYGVAVRRVSEFGLLFSERNGYARIIRVGDWIVKPLVQPPLVTRTRQEES